MGKSIQVFLSTMLSLVIFGPGKLPELGQTLGKTIREFKSAVNNIDEDIKKDLVDLKKGKTNHHTCQQCQYTANQSGA